MCNATFLVVLKKILKIINYEMIFEQVGKNEVPEITVLDAMPKKGIFVL
jgi:adenine-specific DNA methylase